MGQLKRGIMRHKGRIEAVVAVKVLDQILITYGGANSVPLSDIKKMRDAIEVLS